MDRPLLLASGSALAAFLSWSTLAFARTTGAVYHLAQNATWGLIVGALVLALLASDGARGRVPRVLMAIGVIGALARAAAVFLL